MERYEIGSFVFSKSGHDKDKIYIIIKAEDKNLYLADGKFKKIDNLKCKNIKHVGWIDHSDKLLQEKIKCKEKISNEEIKYAIKCYLEHRDV